MPEQRELFDLAAADAANVRIAAQAELADHLASEIVTNPSRFDPKRLGSLGPKGFAVLLAAVRRHDVRGLVPPPRPASAHLEAGAKTSSWRNQRKAEPNHWLRGVLIGVICGCTIIALGFAVATFT